MHLILKNSVNELIQEFEIEERKESRSFELFCNFCVTSKHYLGRFNPIETTTSEDDASIDGIAIVIDGELILSKDDATEIFKTHKTNLTVDIVLVQAKSGEHFNKDEISNFKLGIDDFLSLDPKLPNGKLNSESIKIINTIFDNLKKVKNRQPNISIYYCTTGTYKEEREIKACFELIEDSIKKLDYFDKITVNPLDRGALLKLYNSLTQKNEANLKLIEYCGMPQTPSIPQSYIAVVNAKNYVTSLLMDEEKNLKQSVFEENVRSFLGIENDVNIEICNTLKSPEKRKLFSILNNGVTVVAPELTLRPNTKEINLINYQIINGCQTSNTLYENIDHLDESVNIVIKFIESQNNEASTDVISATNNQSDISKESFLGLKNKAKLVQKYFDAQNQICAPENKIYFERRQCEFRGQPIQLTRIFDVKSISRCYAAMFLDVPHNSARYISRIFSQSGNSIFENDDQESYYYAACLTLYKYQTLINGKKNNAHNFTKFRWHIIQIYKWITLNSMDIPQPNSKKADRAAEKIIKSLNDNNRNYIAKFEECQKIISNLATPSDDEIKRGKFTNTLKDYVATYLKSKNKETTI